MISSLLRWDRGIVCGRRRRALDGNGDTLEEDDDNVMNLVGRRLEVAWADCFSDNTCSFNMLAPLLLQAMITSTTIT